MFSQEYQDGDAGIEVFSAAGEAAALCIIILLPIMMRSICF
jgi:hypothetical protein